SRQKKLDSAAAVAAIVCAFWLYQSALVRPTPAQPADTGSEEISVLLWNKSSGEIGLEHVISLIESYDADVVALVEARQHTTWTQRWWGLSFPQYQLCAFDHGLVLLTKHPVTDIAGGKLDELGKYGLARIQAPRHDYCLILVDIGHYVHSSRGPALAALHDLVTETTDRNLVVLGDFNTPPDSVHFSGLREDLVNAFEVAGSGYGATWPIPLPVLQLDQIWLRPPLVPAECTLGWTWVSDHRPVIARMKINDE
ncbi:MAG: endonuclease/exonuclease/phosphatase family protein, partial [Phycisphaerae bacterium]